MKNKTYIVNTDGGSRGNPGPAAIGVVISQPIEEYLEIKLAIGNTTNNIAEYTAVITALQAIKDKTDKSVPCEVNIEFFLDSELVVKQLNKLYKVKDPMMQTLNSQVNELLKNFNSVKFTHIRREFNKRADQLVNQALDE